MSWASGRRTTRIEDEAYCLLGVFEVSMPLLYGEGRKAFVRLQREITEGSNDCSLLAWRLPDDVFSSNTGLLAGSPASFRGSSAIKALPPPASEPGNELERVRRISIEIKSGGRRLELYAPVFVLSHFDDGFGSQWTRSSHAHIRQKSSVHWQLGDKRDRV